MTNKVPDSGSGDDGNWFLEAVGVTSPSPTGSEAIDDLTRENDIVPATDGKALHSESAATPEELDDDAPLEPIDATEPDDAEQVTPVAEEPGTTATTQIVQTTQVTMSSFDGSPGTTNAAFGPTPKRETTPAPVAPALPDPPLATDSADSGVVALAAAETVVAEIDEDLSRPLRSRRSFRWPVIIVLVLLIIAVGVAAVFMPRAAEAEALAVRQTYYDTTSEVRNYIPEAQAALDWITDETSDIAELSAAIPRIAELDSKSFAMQEAAAEPLPSTLPLVPTAAIDALVPLQDTTASLGDDGSDLANRLGNAYIYRVTIPGLMQTGNLPPAATTETVNEISATLAASLADDAASVSQLPDDPIFSEVQALADQSHQRYAVWQLEYLDALTNEDRESAETLIAEIDATTTELAEANSRALAAFRSEFDPYIVAYAGQLEVHMNNLSRD